MYINYRKVIIFKLKPGGKKPATASDIRHSGVTRHAEMSCRL